VCGGDRPSAVAIALPPGWVDVSEEVAADLARIKEKMGALSKLHGRALLVTFDDDGIDETSVEVDPPHRCPPLLPALPQLPRPPSCVRALTIRVGFVRAWCVR
jgi:hypothetical protein